MRKIMPYKPELVALAKKLRNNMTLGEIALWREIKGKKLGVRFSRQIPIDKIIVDFYCKDLHLVIEEDQQRRDKSREKRLNSLGVHVIRFSNLDVKNNLGWVLGEISRDIERIRPTPNPFQEGNARGGSCQEGNARVGLDSAGPDNTTSPQEKK